MAKSFYDFLGMKTEKESIEEAGKRDFNLMMEAAEKLGVDMGKGELGSIKAAIYRNAALRRDDKFMKEVTRITAAALDAIDGAGFIGEDKKKATFLLTTGLFVMINSLVALEQRDIIKINV